jgi:hypothetical protein
MKLLIDTNVFIPLEPTSHSDQEALTEVTAELHKLAIEAGFQIFLHPAAKIDIEKDSDKERKNLRHVLFEKYPSLPDPPHVSKERESIIGTPPYGSDDWVGKRTVYSLDEINELCQSPVLVILFRQAKVYFPVIPVRKLLSEELFKRPPQSIISVKGKGLSWVKQETTR